MRPTLLGAAALGVALTVSISKATEPCCCVCPGAIYCSPVFHMPLQPAPSPIDGGYWVVLPCRRVQGPNYCLRPPFNPVEGFSGAELGQAMFQKVLMDELKPQKTQLPQTRGLGTFNHDYSDAQNLPYFGHGMPPYAGPMFTPPGPQPGYPNMPGHPGASPDPRVPSPRSMVARAPQVGVHQVGYYWPGPSPIVPVQAMALPSPGYSMGHVPLPAYGWAPNHGGYHMPAVPMPNYAMNYVPMPSPGYGGSYVPLPTLPSPWYGAPAVPLPTLPAPGYSLPAMNLPTPGYTPNLPTVGYEPPCPGPTTACYPSHALVRSPRDFFMWGEAVEDEVARQRRTMPVP